MSAAAHAPQTVSTVTAVKTTWQAQIQAVGSLRAVRGADLSAQASGVVDDIEFDSGNDVPAGKPFARGAGGASRYAIGLVISTGLGIGTLFTLFVVPGVYMLISATHSDERMEIPV